MELYWTRSCLCRQHDRKYCPARCLDIPGASRCPPSVDFVDVLCGGSCIRIIPNARCQRRLALVQINLKCSVSGKSYSVCSCCRVAVQECNSFTEVQRSYARLCCRRDRPAERCNAGSEATRHHYHLYYGHLDNSDERTRADWHRASAGPYKRSQFRRPTVCPGWISTGLFLIRRRYRMDLS